MGTCRLHVTFFLGGFIFLAELAGFLVPGLAFGQDSAEENFREALICYGELNYPCSIQKLASAEKTEKERHPKSKLLVDVYQYKAYSLIAIGDQAGASEAFRALLDIEPDFPLGPDKVSPKIYTLFLTVKQERLSQKSKEEPAPTIPATPKPLAKPEVSAPPPETKAPKETWPFPEGIAGLSGSAAFLLGDDSSKFHVGFNLDAFAEAEVGEGFFVGGALLYQRHESKGKHDSLNVVGILAQASWAYSISRFYLRLPLGVGFATYGWGEARSKQGMIWRFTPDFNVRIVENFGLGLQVGPGGVIDFSRKAASTFLVTGLAAFGSW